MERDSETEGSFIDSDSHDLIDKSKLTISESIKLIVASNARADLNNEYRLLLFLQSWWSKTYNRPLKDPLLATYTIEELIYEFYDKIEREKAAEERAQSENDKIEENKEKEALDWAEQEEKRELEELNSNNSDKKAIDPAKDPDNLRWMEEQIEKAKEEYGEDFGEDIDESF